MRIQTSQGKQVDILLESDLGDYVVAGERIRTYCPVHGGDHQKSLSIDPKSGWGHCFNASCNATVLVRDFNPDVAGRLLQRHHPVPSRPEPIVSRRPAAARSATTWQQSECAALLQQNELFCRALFNYELADCWQAQAYLETRSISLEIAQRERLGYISKDLLRDRVRDQSMLARWSERLLFPLTSPTGRGFAGRSLWRWQIGMDEAIHKALLDAEPDAPSRWLKTNPAGWFCARPVDFGDRLILVEGAFDRLALLAGGFPANEVVALVGTSAHLDWLPEQIQHVVLALDGDEAGIGAMWKLVEPLTQQDRDVYLCPPPDDMRGKDWSERWRRAGFDGLAELYNTFDLIP